MTRERVPTVPHDFEGQLGIFLTLAGRQAFTETPQDAFIAWFRSTVPVIFPELLRQIPDHPEEVRRFLHVAAKSLYADLPRPSTGLLAPGRETVDRDAPCDCGSGATYRYCCGGSSMPPLFGQMNLLRYVLDACPKSRLALVSTSQASLEAVADTAAQWLEEGGLARAVALLEPYFQGEETLTGQLAPLFHVILDVWLEMGKLGKREKLIAAILTRGDRALRSDAWQRRTTMLSDRGNFTAAWQAFEEARALNPNDPALSFLEVTTLLHEGRVAQAQGQARWWAAFLAKQRNSELESAIERLHALAEDPHAGLMAVAMRSNPQLARLNALMGMAPAPAVHHRFDVAEEGDGTASPRYMAGNLIAGMELGRLESLWEKTFRQAKPELTWLQHGDASVWDTADDWLALLQKHPSLWFSFDVLDDLVMAVDAVPLAGVEERLLVPLAERAVEQLQITLEASALQPLQCPWGFLNHRPALRPVAHLAYICKAARGSDEGKAQRFMELAHWLVFELNPNDNHGLRADLSCAFAKHGRWEDVLALQDRYPEDMEPTLALNAVLASWVMTRGDDTARDLHQAARDFPVVVKMLVAEAPKPVKPDNGYGVAIGGRYEAWLYVKEMRPVWELSGALDWARATLASKAAKSKKSTRPVTSPVGRR